MDTFDQSPNDSPSVLTYDNIKGGANEGQDRPDNSQATNQGSKATWITKIKNAGCGMGTCQ
jgi:urocanate hydratase